MGLKFMPAEAWWILSGDNKVETIKPYSKTIEQFSDDGVTFMGAYGPPVVDQLSWCTKQLLADPFTRQSVLTIWRPRPGSSRDVPCTVSLQFTLRRDPDEPDDMRVNCHATMRSSDAWLGWPYDVFNFSMISGFVAASLMNQRPGFGVRMGQLYLTAASQHLYQEQWDAARDCVGWEIDPDSDEPIDRGYEEDFDYRPFDPGDYWQRPHDLVDHLKALADRRYAHARGSWLMELFEERPDA